MEWGEIPRGIPTLSTDKEGQMIPVIRKILYATDLSENSAFAFRYAVALAKKFDAEIVVLHVEEPIPESVRIYMQDDFIKKKAKIKKKQATDRIKHRLKVFCERELKGDQAFIDRVVTIKVSQGYPAEEILTQSEKMGCDAIVMGTHGKGMMTHAFLGSVAERILRRVSKPTFVIPLPKGEKDLSFTDF
jgi:nucleotide-binding universal stress UspA family protein